MASAVVNELPLAEVLPPLASSTCDSSSEAACWTGFARADGMGELTERCCAAGRVPLGGGEFWGEVCPADDGGAAETCNGCFVDHLQYEHNASRMFDHLQRGETDLAQPPFSLPFVAPIQGVPTPRSPLARWPPVCVEDKDGGVEDRLHTTSKGSLMPK